MKRHLATLLLSGVILGACSTGASAPTTTTISRYDRYVELTNQYGGDVIDQKAAPVRAALDCNGSGKDIRGGVPLSEFPTDLALVQAYCPDKNPDDL